MLVNEFTIAKAKADLAVEIEPAIKKLIENAEDGVRMLEKQESLLQKTVSGRRACFSSTRVIQSFFIQLNSRRAPGTTASDQVEMRRAQQLKRQRERLEKEMKELQAEVEDLVRSFISLWQESSLTQKNVNRNFLWFSERKESDGPLICSYDPVPCEYQAYKSKGRNLTFDTGQSSCNSYDCVQKPLVL